LQIYLKLLVKTDIFYHKPLLIMQF